MSQQEIKREKGELGHFAWCLLVALKLAQQSGKVTNKTSEHLFVMGWLANAQKYKLFSRAVASDILWLQSEGKKKGAKANLIGNADYWWKIHSGQVANQDDLFRLTYFIERAQQAGWQSELVDDKDWMDESYSYPKKQTVYMRKMDLIHAYDDNMKRLQPVEMRFTGNVVALLPALAQAYLHYTQPVEVGHYMQIEIVD
ncbi:DUF2913 family protein [Nissabacter sp. SGAir0207]|uniref:DUF2913 family protein n=1 Tax=Nissabacter sp. SGAir0207 TaxID=2126321 RepID=UPI00143D5108|nr:DUF2913 family protein [Nissabacter sp. SGAir0207]